MSCLLISFNKCVADHICAGIYHNFVSIIHLSVIISWSPVNKVKLYNISGRLFSYKSDLHKQQIALKALLNQPQEFIGYL